MMFSMQEAYVKAMGTGINETPLKNFTFSFSHSDRAQSYLESAMNVSALPQVRKISSSRSETHTSMN